MSSAHLIPDSSPYASELHHGLPRLRFSASLERHYVNSRLARVHWRVRIWQTLGLAIATFFTFSKVAQMGWRRPVCLLHLGLLMPLALILAWAAWSRRYAQVYPSVARVLIPLVVACAAIFSCRGASLGHPEELAVLCAQMPCLFLMSGLLFRDNVVSAAAMLIAYVAASLVLRTPPPTFVEFSIFLTLIAGVAATTGWEIEYTTRKGFLSDRILAELVTCDSLTGLSNRRGFDERLEQMWSQALRERRRLGLVMLDVDHFKLFNDCNGHQAGDRVLRCVAACARSLARRPLDMAARFGGDEFALLFYDLSADHLTEVVERLRCAVTDLRIQHSASPIAPVVTITVGVASISPIAGRSSSGILQLADTALYRAKRAGRNRVELAGEEEYRTLQTGVFNSPRFA